MQIFVRTLTGKVYYYDVNSTDTCRDLKQKIQDSAGFPIDRQTIMLLKKSLKDEQLISECNLLYPEHSLIYNMTCLYPFYVILRSIKDTTPQSD